MNYRLYESSGCVAECPAFAGLDDFDALRLWAVEHNDWKGIRQGAVIASDASCFWYVRRDGSVREVSNVRRQTGGCSQVEKLAPRLDASRPFTPETGAHLGY